MAKVKKLKKTPSWVKKSKNAKYNLHELEVGDLRTFPVDEIGCKDIKSFRAYLWHRSKQLGFDLKCRQLPNGSIEVYRRA